MKSQVPSGGGIFLTHTVLFNILFLVLICHRFLRSQGTSYTRRCRVLTLALARLCRPTYELYSDFHTVPIPDLNLRSDSLNTLRSGDWDSPP